MRSKNKTQISEILTIAFMVSLLVCAVAVTPLFRIFRDPYVMTNSFLGIAVLTGDLILMIYVFFFTFRDIQNIRLLIPMIITTFLSTFCSVCTYEAYGMAEYSTLILIAYTLAYVIAALYWLLMWMYIRDVSKQNVGQRIMDYCIIFAVTAYILLCITNLFSHSFFTVINGEIVYIRCTLPNLFWCILTGLFIIRIVRSDYSKKKKWAFFGYLFFLCVLRILESCAEIFGFEQALESVYDLCAVLSMHIIFFSIYNERDRKLLRSKADLMQSQLNTVILQVNPDFIYSTLSSIEDFCDRDPMAAKSLLNDFTRYLRSNSVNLTKRSMIPFEQELKNLKAYLRIEQMRFPNLRVEYEIGTVAFLVPCLSVQPLVENAIKHGIGGRYDKTGTVTIQTEEFSDCWGISVMDDGVGFSGIPKDGQLHRGVANVRKRLAMTCGGTLNVSGITGKGTIAKIIIPKRWKKAEKTK